MTASSKTKSSKAIWWIAGVVILTSGWLGYKLSVQKTNSNKGSKNSQLVERQDLVQRSTIAGTITPERLTIVTAPFNGYVKKLFVKIGDHVKTDAPLVSIVQSLQSTEPVFPLRSPFAGVVVEVLKEEGQFVKKDDPKDYVLRIDSLKQLYAVSNVPELDRARIVPGQEVVIKASAILDKKYKGVVDEVALASRLQNNWRSNSKVEFRTKIKILDFDDDLKPGMSAIIDIITHKKESVLTLPHEYLIKDGGQYFALLENGERAQIEVGLQNESHFEVTKGLKEGQRVLQVDFMKLLADEGK